MKSEDTNEKSSKQFITVNNYDNSLSSSGGAKINSKTLKLKREHPLNNLQSLLDEIAVDNNPFVETKHILILPDNISINNLTNYVASEKPKANSYLSCFTFESLAKEIVQQCKNYNPTILENHYLRVFVTQYIREKNSDSNIAHKIYQIIKNAERPERTQIIEDLVRDVN